MMPRGKQIYPKWVKNQSPDVPNWFKMTLRDGKMTTWDGLGVFREGIGARFAEHLGPGGTPGALRELQGPQKVDFGSTLGREKDSKSDQNEVKSRKKRRVEERRREKKRSK